LKRKIKIITKEYKNKRNEQIIKTELKENYEIKTKVRV
jgi:hypothetical protein